MKFVETLTVGGDKVSASNNGKIVINQTLGEISVREAESPRVAVRLSAEGLMQYTGGKLLTKLDTSGFQAYDSNGTMVTKVDSSGVHQYNTDGMLLINLGTDGLKQYGTDGALLISLGVDGLRQFNSDGVMLLQLNASGLIQYKDNGTTQLLKLDTSGLLLSEPDGTARILIGAHPTDGHIVEAISAEGTDVLTALRS